MEVEVIQRTCDQCGRQSEYHPKLAGSSYFRGWWRLQESFGSGRSSVLDFCCIKCVKNYIVKLRNDLK